MFFFETKPIDQVAFDWAERRHRGETFKYMNGPLFDHPRAVADRQVTVESYVKAILHDTTENRVKAQLKKLGMYQDGEALLSIKVLFGTTAAELAKNRVRPLEEKLIKLEFFKMKGYFAWHGHDIRSIIPALDANTPRTTETRLEAFDRLTRFVDVTGDKDLLANKRADIEFNVDPAHNQPLADRSENTRRRHLDYHHELVVLAEKYPDARLRDAVAYVPKPLEAKAAPSSNNARPGVVRQSFASVLSLLA